MKVSHKTKNILIRRTIIGFVFWIFISFLIFVVFSLFAYLKFLWVNLGDGIVVAETWLDSNGDGIRGSTEPPLGGVCILTDYGYPNLEPDACDDSWTNTDVNGRWETMVGGTSPVFVSAFAPPGYKSTTPPVVRNDSPDQFGFAPISTDVKQKILPMEEYARIYRLEEEQESLRIKIVLIVGILGYLAVSVSISWFLAMKVVKPKQRLTNQRQ
jgi:hypothetical protein